MKRSPVLITGLIMCALASQSTSQAADAESRAKQFVARYEADVRPLEIATNLAWWKANTTGKDEDFAAKGRPRTSSTRPWPTASRSPSSRRCTKPRSPTRSSPARSTCSTCSYLEKQVDPRAAQADHRQGQRHREGVQRLPRQGRRQGDDRQRSPQGPQRVEGLRRAPGRLGGEQGRRRRSSRPT